MDKKITILIVDDNHQNLRVVSSFLKDKNYNLALATSGEKTLELLEKIHTDLILLDIMMPEMDGLETCRILKENPKTADIPVIFLTAKNQTEDIVEGFKAGGVDYITKPFNREELLVRIKNHVDLAKAKNKIIEMNNTRDKLYSIIAHDIKSPLNS
ncbi:MAG: response regulator, partial [Bacteroidota bacterium]